MFEPGQDLYEFLKDTIRIHTSEGTIVKKGNAMITKWPVGNSQLLPMRTVARIADVPKNLKDISTYRIPEQLWNQLLHVNFPNNYNADGSEVPQPNYPPLSQDALDFSMRMLNRALHKFKTS